MDNNTRYCSVFNQDSSERVIYNNPLFPVSVRYGLLSSYPDYSAVSHWHEDLEFIVIKQGKMTYNVNGELFSLTKDRGIMVNSRQLHYGFSREHEECEFICILLSPELLRGNTWFYQSLITCVIENAACPCVSLDRVGWQAVIVNKLEELYESYEHDPDTAKALSCFDLVEGFLSILKILYQNLDGKQTGRTRESAELAALRAMICYIEEHYACRITLTAIAAAGACCKSKCSLLFRKYLHDTPIAYVTRFRLRKSLVPLLDSDRSITDIAYEHGFGGVSYYCETFQKYYGLSPLQYRKTHFRQDCAARHHQLPDI